MSTTAIRTAFYYRRAGEKRWTLGGVFADAESAWTAALELDAKDVDLWFPQVPADGEQVPAELTKRQQQNFRVARHLNESQRAMVGAQLANMKAGNPSLPNSAHVRNCNNVPQAKTAELLNISERLIQQAKQVERDAVPG